MTAGQTTSAQLVKFYFDRIAAHDQSGPRLNAVPASTNPRAVAEARPRRRAQEAGSAGAALHGIPALPQRQPSRPEICRRLGGSLALSGRDAERRCLSGQEAASGWRGCPGQSELTRTRARPDDGELAWRADTRSVRPVACARWIERRPGVAASPTLQLSRWEPTLSGSDSNPEARTAASWVSGRPPASRAGRGSSRSATRRIQADPWRERSPDIALVLRRNRWLRPQPIRVTTSM